jgi:hypothetical protein
MAPSQAKAVVASALEKNPHMAELVRGPRKPIHWNKRVRLPKASADDDPKTLALGIVSTATPLGNNLPQDPLIASVQAALNGGGDNTAEYFNSINTMGQVFSLISANGRDALIEADDTTLPGSKVFFTAVIDSQDNPYYIQIAADNVSTDSDGNVQLDGGTITIDGKEYNTFGTVRMDCGYSNFAFSSTSWQIGTGLAGTVAMSKILPPLVNLLKSVAGNVTDSIKNFASKFQNGDDNEPGEEESEAEAEDTAGDTEIIEEAGGDVAIEAAEDAAISLGDIFVGAGIFLAIAFIAISFILHNTYHKVRLWNFTGYTLQWYIYFDASQLVDEGGYIKAPAQFDDNNNVTSYSPIQPLQTKIIAPKAPPINQCSYGDFNMISSHDYSGIGYVMRLTLVDSNDNNVYMGAVLFDIPFEGTNSLATTFNIENGDDSTLQSFYTAFSGRFPVPEQAACSDDGKISLSATYDYLSGKHPMQSQGGADSGSNEAYFYQSVVVIDQLALTNGTVNPPVISDAAGSGKSVVAATPALLGVNNLIRSIAPKYKQRVYNHIKKKNLGKS